MASSMCGGDQVRSTKTSVLCLQSSMVVGMSWSGAAWVLQVLESYISLRETWALTCTVKYGSRAWSPPSRNWVTGQCSSMTMTQTHLQDDHCFTKEDEGKSDGLAKHVSTLEPNRTSLGHPQADGGGGQSLKYPPAPQRRQGGVRKSVQVATYEALINSIPRRKFWIMMVVTQNIDSWHGVC